MPFELTHHPGYFLIRAYGIVHPGDLTDMVARAIEIEREHPEGVNRIADLSDVEVFNVQYAAISDFAKKRREQMFSRVIKSAVVADRPVAVGFARMFQTILNHPQIEVQLFETLEAARAWVTAEKA